MSSKEIKTINSPCIGVCVLSQDDVCEGCFRTSDEIAHWSAMDNNTKQLVVTKSWERARQSGNVL